MKIKEIYHRFSVPQNLAQHMFRVFGVVSLIGENWTGQKLDWELLKKLTLFHDLGNIVKFNLKEEEMYLKDTQLAMIEKYGTDDHEATGIMIKELGFDDESVDIIQSKSFGSSIAIANSSNYLLKTLYYADMRVLPNGIGLLEDRLSDVRNRMPKYTNRSDFEDLVKASREVERQIQEKLKISLSSIDDNSIKTFISESADFEI